MNQKNAKIKYVWGPFAAIAFIVILLDVMTKIWAAKALPGHTLTLIDGVLELKYLENTGAAWGMFAGARSFFLAATVVVFLLILLYLGKMPAARRHLPMTICLSLMFSGALGNFYDRFVLQYVRDFIYFALIDFPIFNVADIAISCSAVMLVILVLFVYKDEDFAFLSRKKAGKASSAGDMTHE